MEAQEGVIKFKAEHATGPLDPGVYGATARPLLAWRRRLFDAGLVGQDPARYDGAGYGNVSARITGSGEGLPFLVTATQTGGRRELALVDLCVVEAWNEARNAVTSHGPALPSSESMTHGSLYAVSRRVRFVFHGHSPEVFAAAGALALPVTDPSVGYGTPEMAAEVRRLFHERPGERVIVMGGHEDGVLAYGASGHEAGSALLGALRAARRVAA